MNSKSYHSDTVYLDLLKEIVDKGELKGDRTGTGTRGLFGTQMRFDLSQGFPLLTTKKVPFNAVAHELLWFLRGDTNIRNLVLNKVNIWNEWPYKAYLLSQGLVPPASNSEEWKKGIAEFVARIATDENFAKQYGNLGPVYGYQWRSWKTPDGRIIDQIAEAVKTIKTNPNSRRIIVSAWNPADIEEMAISGLPPCHCLFQFFVNNGKLSCQLYQRSADYFLGVPFNIASYALLTRMMAQVCNLEAGEFIWTGGDTHLYNNHVTQAQEQLSREPRSMPTLTIKNRGQNIDEFTLDDFIIENYNPHETIKAPIAV